MHLLISAAYFYPHRGGYELYVEEIAKRLSKKSIRVTVVTCNTESTLPREKWQGIEIIRLPGWQLLGGTYPIPKPSKLLFSLVKYIKAEQVDVINTQTRFFITSFIGWCLAKITHRPLVHTEHGTRHVELSSWWARWLSVIYDHTLGWLVIKTADSVVASSFTAGEFAKHLGAQTYTVIYNGVDTSYFRPAINNNNSEKSILYVGRLIEAKGVQDLIKVFLKLVEADHNLSLTIVGAGNYELQLKELGRDDRIKFAGRVETKNLLDLYQQAKVFVNPSYAEGLPTSVLEALACACPVIATDVGGTKEIIAGTKAGQDQMRLYKPHDMEKLKEYLSEYLSRIEQTRPVDMTTFSWDHGVAIFYQLLAKYLNPNLATTT